MTRRTTHFTQPLAKQNGAALLLAMLTVTLVATLASAALWQQWRHTEVEQAERERLQASWVLTGALDWARLILREDARTNQSTGAGDHLAEPWAIGLQEARLSSFLAADKTQDPPPALDAFLSGDILDQQARLNLTNLVDQNALSEPDLRMFARLFDQLGLNPAELLQAARLMVAAHKGLTQSAQTAGNGQTGVGGTPMVPQRLSQAAWLGLSALSLARLEPFVTVLPERTPINLNTAPPEVLVACIAGLDMARARRLVQQRALQPFKTLADATRLIPGDNAIKSDVHSTASRYFEVRGSLRMGPRIIQERSLVLRSGLDVKTLWRERVAGLTVGAAPDSSGETSPGTPTGPSAGLKGASLQ